MSKSWGGPRKNAGGARPFSGPLKKRIENFRPFSHSAKGDTYSQVSIFFERCNRCGAMAWASEQGEQLYMQEGEMYDTKPRYSIADRPLIHMAGCNNQ